MSATLTEEQKTIVILRALHNVKPLAIAAECGCSEYQARVFAKRFGLVYRKPPRKTAPDAAQTELARYAKYLRHLARYLGKPLPSDGGRRRA